MGKKATKAADNMYYQARCEAAEKNEEFSSREKAAEIVGIDRTRLARIELDAIMPYPEEVKAMGDVPVMSGLFICPNWQEKEKVIDPENSGLLPSEMATAVRGSMDAGAAGICLFTPSRMSPEHWAELDKLVL